MGPVDSIVDAIPRHLAIGPGGPWRITRNTLRTYNRENRADFPYEAMPNGGRDIAAWLIRKITSALTIAGEARGRTPTPEDVVTGYLAGWKQLVREYQGKPFKTIPQKWRDLARAIVYDAQHPQSLMHETREEREAPDSGVAPAASTVLDPTEIVVRKRNPWLAKPSAYSAAQAALWGGLSFLALWGIAKKKPRGV